MSLCLGFLIEQVKEITILPLSAVLMRGGGDPLGGLGTVPSTEASQPQLQGHCRLDPSLWWGLSCALQELEQHPWPIPTRRQ